METTDVKQISISVNSKILTAPYGKTLLEFLREQGIYIPSACGGRGKCGLCKVAIEENIKEPLKEAELIHLNEGEKAHGIRLACQRIIRSEISVKIPEEYFSAKEFKAEVAKIKDLTYDIKEIVLKLIEPATIDFKAGQYVELRIPPYGTHKKFILRAYSIASPPQEQKSIALQIRKVLNGIATTYIFEHLKEGAKVTFYGPAGNFFLRQNDKPILMIAGGSGMAPMKSILLHMLNKKIAKKVRYFFGAKAKKDLFYLELMELLEKQLPDFKFIPALSNPDQYDHWEGEKGLISEVVNRNIAQGEFSEAYLCGSPAMIEACLKILNSKGIQREKIFFDSFS